MISAFGPKLGQEDTLVAFMEHAINIFAGNQKTRLLICGGVGPMYFDLEKKARVSDSTELPKAFVPLAKGESHAYDLLKERKDFNWIYFTPPLELTYKGEETGAYKTGGEVLQFSAAGESSISYSDYASAIVDEAFSQKPKHNQIVSVVNK